MRREVLTESRPEILELEPDQADALRRAGGQLASDRTWWGADEEDESDSQRSVISCRPVGSGRYAVRISNAVGVVSVGDLQLAVRPKIPTSHFLFLLSHSTYLPRLDAQQASLQAGDDLFRLIARWFVQSLEKLLRRGLMKDYSEEQDFLSAKRGRIQTAQTAKAYYRGRIGLHCEFDEFNTDTALNRIVRGAARLVVRRSELPRSLRRRARSAASRMPDVGRLQPNDFRAQLTRRTAHYRDALLLGKQLLRSEGRFLGHGQKSAWTFLIRTPDLVEDGLRNLLREAFGDAWKIEKKGVKPTPSVSFTPDLVINDGDIVGDVKYKLFSSDWNRGDLYQIVAFCTAFRSEQGFVLAFKPPAVESPPETRVGDVQVRPVSWPADPELGPGEAFEEFRTRFQPVLTDPPSVLFSSAG